MNNENMNNNIDTQSNVTDIPVNNEPINNTVNDVQDTPVPVENVEESVQNIEPQAQTVTQTAPSTEVPVETMAEEVQSFEPPVDSNTDEIQTPIENISDDQYDIKNDEFFEDNQSNINKSINNHSAVVDQYNQVSDGYIDDSEGISSYEEQIKNSQDISLYTQQPNENNYNDEYVFNEDINNYDDQYGYGDSYDDGYGYDNNYYDDNTMAYNNSGYSSYGNNFDALNSGGYNMNSNFTVAPSYAPPTNNMVNFNQQPMQVVQPIPTIQVVPVAVQQPTAGELISDGTNHPKTIGAEEFQRKVKASRRPVNFMLLGIYAIIIAVIGYFGYTLWLEKNAYTLSKDRMTIVLGHSYSEVIYERGKLDVNTNYEWKSENEEIATVDENGKISAKKEGTVTITVKSKKTKKVRKVMVEVANIQIKTFEVTPKDKTLKVGEAYQFYPSVNGSAKYLVNVVWKSSNENVATVSSDGIITTKTPGTTVITVAIPNTKFKANMNIKVK